MQADHTNPWKTLDSTVVHKNKWYSVRKDTVITPSGLQGEYNVVVGNDAVFIVALDEHENVCLVGLYRYPTNTYSLEIPAGSTDGQDPLEAAKRELCEEAGLAAETWKLLGKVQSANGLLSEFGYVYLATHLSKVGNDEQAQEGIDKQQNVPFDDIMQMIKAGGITDGQSMCLAGLYLNKF